MSNDKEDFNQERINALIDQNLKLVFADLVEDELPDRFKDLLDILSAQDAEDSGQRE